MAAEPPAPRPRASPPVLKIDGGSRSTAPPPELVRSSRMAAAAAAAEVPTQVEPSAATEKRSRAECEEDGDEREERRPGHKRWRVLVTSPAATATATGTPSICDSSVTASDPGTSTSGPRLRQQLGHLLSRVMEGESENSTSTCPQMMRTAIATPVWSPSISCARTLPSPRNRKGGLAVEETGCQTNRKRKSPSIRMPFLRTPLSRMLLSPQVSPRMHMSPRVHVSPRISPLALASHRNGGGRRALQEIDLNLPPVDLNVEPEGMVLDLTMGAQAPVRKKRKVIPDDKRKAIFDALVAKANKGDLEGGHETGEVSLAFSVPVRTVQRIWQDGKKCMDEGKPIDVSSRKTKKCGRKKKQVDVSKLSKLSILDRSTLDDVSKQLDCSKSKVHSMRRSGEITRVSNSIKPYLTETNKRERLKWCLSMLDPRTVPHNPMFKGLFDFVFIDEKWFYTTRKTYRYYAAPGEEQPARTCKNKRFIPKLMILSAYARPRFDADKNCIFDGKIGCFPFVIHQAAKRSSKNRPAGTVELKPIDSIKKDVAREFMINKLLPAIRAKWPREDMNKPIFIQQDNAKPHLAPNDREFCEAAKQDGFDIRLICQPANSPDLNILDLGFFNSIQSIQYKTSAKNTEELVFAIKRKQNLLDPPSMHGRGDENQRWKYL